MPENTPMATVSIHYWAGARAAAGVRSEHIEASTVAQALELARTRRADPQFDRVLSVSAVLIAGVSTRTADLDRVLDGDLTVEILPPFAGGAGSEGALCS